MWLSGLYNKVSSKLEMEEFQEIFEELFPELCLYAAKFVPDFDTSKDIVQDVLAKFWEESDRLLNRDRTKSYLYRAVKNRALNYNKRERRKTGLDELIEGLSNELEDSGLHGIESEMLFKNLQDDLENAIDELPEQRRKIFRMSRFEQMRHKEIALELGISPKTVETQIYRSLNFLREKLKKYLV